MRFLLIVALVIALALARNGEDHGPSTAPAAAASARVIVTLFNYAGCKLGLDRDLVRVAIEVSE
jgi:hypothetical protein